MVINVSKEMNFNDIKEMVWSGAISTINRVEEEQKQDEWFDTDYIYENLGITDED